MTRHLWQAIAIPLVLSGPWASAQGSPPSNGEYLIEGNIQVPTAGTAAVCAYVARSRRAEARRPTLLTFTIYADSLAAIREAGRSAANGFVGVVGFTRGKGCGRGETIPYLHDGEDAAALIKWIARQPWSDGRVGMYGGSYSGFTAWAAAKYHPAPLRAIMVGAPVGPGMDVPMEGNVFFNFLYPWPFYTLNTAWLDTATYNDFARWNRLNREWYRTGRPYRELEQIDGTPNPGFAAWIAHPSLDEFWRSMLPTPKEFSAITIPVLQTAGYFFGGPGAAVWYLRQHYRHNPRAQHYLVIGPWDHPQAQRGVVRPGGDTTRFIAGYETDPVSRVDLVADLRYQWFDHVLRGAPRPALLQDRINYEVPGANLWRHAPSLESMANRRLRLWFDPIRSGGAYGLNRAPVASTEAITMTVNFADRSDVDRALVGGIVARVVDTANAVVLVSEPMDHAIEIGGLLSGHLELIVNKQDFDFSITPYELMADGSYFQLPPFLTRASYAATPETRRLLKPGAKQTLNFEATIRLMSRQVAAGSRLVLVLAVPKSPNQQINYGTGKDVSDESIGDGETPLRIEWLPGSYVELPTCMVNSDSLPPASGLPDGSLTLRSALRGRAILAQAIGAVGGLEKLQRLHLTREYQGIRTDEGQNVRPAEAGLAQPVNGRPRLVRIRDYEKGVFADFSSDTIPGDQPIALRSVIRGDTGYTYMYDAGTLRLTTGTALRFWRSLYQREEIEGLLLAAWGALPGVRWLANTLVDTVPASALTFTDAAGITLTLYVARDTHLPIKSETVDDDPVRGDVMTETLYLDWRQVSGVRVPHEVRILVAGREVQRQRLTSLAVGPTPHDSLFAWPSHALAIRGGDGTVVELAPDVYVVQTRYQSMVTVFDDFVMVLEPGGSPRDAQTVIDAARRLAPGKPIRYVLATHAHYDHLAGIRPFVATGATFLSTGAAGAVIEYAAKALHLMAPDSLSRNPRPVRIEVVDSPVRIIRDGRHEVQLYQLGPTAHVEAMLFAYIPAARTLFVADALDIPAPGHTRSGGSDTQRLADRIAELGLDIETIVPVHGQPGTIRDLRGSLAKRAGVNAETIEPSSRPRPRSAR